MGENLHLLANIHPEIILDDTGLQFKLLIISKNYTIFKMDESINEIIWTSDPFLRNFDSL
jgi:hypothetical protein